jgi:membrane protein DedA with SNARE-associated domain
MVEHLFTPIISWYMANLNYATIVLLMAIESSFLPLPSELVVPPAAWLAAQGQMNLVLVILAGSVGSVVGALFNYTLSLIVGRKVIYSLIDSRLAALLLLNRHKYEKAEKFYLKYGKSSTFIGRLVPVVRHLISIPAGLAKMRMFDFVLYTFLGSLLWNAILAGLGYYLYSQKELLEKYYGELSYLFLALGVVFVGFVIYKMVKKSKGNGLQNADS